MKTLVTVFVCAALALVGGSDANAKKKPRHSSTQATKPKHEPQRASDRPRRPAPTMLAETSDELVLSPNLLRKLQSNLIDGGYLTGTIDGRLTRRTRRALAEFQREYHLPGTGALDRTTAEALLGHDEISSFLVAHAN